MDRRKGILAVVQSEEVEWEVDGLQSKKFKNHELKSRLTNMGIKNIFSFTVSSLHKKWYS